MLTYHDEQRLRTARLELIACGIERLQRLQQGPEAYRSAYQTGVIEGYLDFPQALEFSITRMQGESASAWWAPFVFVLEAEQAVVGLGGYKGPPDGAGVVEIGYSIAPTHQGQGFATEAAHAMVLHALRRTGVLAVRAHTLPERNASARVLEKNGFRKVAETIDPDDGVVWRWERERGAGH